MKIFFSSTFKRWVEINLAILLTWNRTESGFIKFCGSWSAYNQSGSTSLLYTQHLKLSKARFILAVFSLLSFYILAVIPNPGLHRTWRPLLQQGNQFVLFVASLFFNLSYDEGGHIVPPQSVFIFLPKMSPPDQTLRPTCKFLILGLLYHDFFFLLKI